MDSFARICATNASVPDMFLSLWKWRFSYTVKFALVMMMHLRLDNAVGANTHTHIQWPWSHQLSGWSWKLKILFSVRDGFTEAPKKMQRKGGMWRKESYSQTGDLNSVCVCVYWFSSKNLSGNRDASLNWVNPLHVRVQKPLNRDGGMWRVCVCTWVWERKRERGVWGMSVADLCALCIWMIGLKD